MTPGSPRSQSVADDWGHYGGDPGGTRFSSLSQIDRSNVSSLEPAWIYRTGETALTGEGGYQADGWSPAFQTTPLIIDDVLYLTTPSSRVIALDAETGIERWTFDPYSVNPEARVFRSHRGVAYWEDSTGVAGCDRSRILFGTGDGRLMALDASSGRPCPDFGEGGVVDLRMGVADRWPDAMYAVTSPPTVFKDLVITGAMVPEDVPRGPAGDVRAFDVRTGALIWQFHTVPRPGQPGHDTWEEGAWENRSGVNVWSMMSVDTHRGMLFLPIGSASYDFYGGDRKGKNLYANSLVALKAETGELLWHYQTVRHDLWDYDPPAQPLLALVKRGVEEVPAVIQVTKMGFVFVLNRITGEPFFPVEERSVPQSTVPGEVSWPTQPFPLKPPPLARQTALVREDLTTVTPESNRFCTDLFDQVATSGGLYTPTGLDLTLWFPGTLGGANWSGASFDPSRGYLFVNVNEIGALGLMEPQAPSSVVPYRRNSPWGAYARFWDDNELPCQQPPWGKLHAVDLNEGEIAWTVPLGIVEELAERGIENTGAPNIGGSIVTAGGLVFIGGTNDRRFRAFDSETGELLWTTTLEASAHATPATFLGRKSGKQFVVVAAGGGGFFSRTYADTVVAFSLPN